MVLIFLRDWRSALIVVLNIPFALLSAVILLWATGQTINIMTLGGLALAVGVLVDEATVEIENIHTRMLPGVSRARAVMEACSRTAIARLLSMLCILAVFVPSFFMVGRGTPAVRASVAGGGLRHDRVVSAFQHAGSGVRGMADEAGASGRGERLGAPDVFAVCAISAESAMAAGDRLRGRVHRDPIFPDASAGNGNLSRHRTPACCGCGCALQPARASKRRSGWCCGRWM